jgi:hypothetical protein
MTRLGASGKRWLWLRDGLIPAGQAVSETIPLYALVVLITATGQHGLALSYLVLARMAAVAAWATRLTDLLTQRWYFGRIVLGFVSVVALVTWVHLTLAPEAAWDPMTTLTLLSRPWRIDPGVTGAMLFIAWLLAICLWSRGLWIGLEAADARIEARWFVGGMAVLLLLSIVTMTGHAAQANAVGRVMRLLVLAYFFVGLLVLALVHASTLRGTGGPVPGASVPWVIAVAVPIATIPIVGFLLTAGVAPAVRMTMRAAVVAAIVAWQVALWIGYWILLFLRWLSSLFPAGSEGPLHSRAMLPRPPPRVKLPQLQTHFALSTFNITAVFIVLVFVLLLALLVWLLTRQRARVEAPVQDDERSSVWSWALFLAQLRGLWAWLWHTRHHGRARHATSGANSPAMPDDEYDVRTLYRRFQQRAAELRHPRAPATTPIEFARSLFRLEPRHSQEIGLVTEIYDRARYGQKTTAPEHRAAMRDAVRRWENRPQSAEPAESREEPDH